MLLKSRLRNVPILRKRSLKTRLPLSMIVSAANSISGDAPKILAREKDPRRGKARYKLIAYHGHCDNL